jgi:hypothetical protein
MNVRTYRRATRADLEFITTTIIEADKSGTPATLYERVFDLAPADLTRLLRQVLQEDIAGSELYCESFWLAIEAGQPVAGLATWVEGADGLPSNLIRANLLSSALGMSRWKLAEPRLRALSSIEIRRTPGALQLESVYVVPSRRGKGLVGELIAHALAHVEPGILLAQVLVAVGNLRSERAFSKAGFEVSARTIASEAALKELFPGEGRLLLERAVRNGGRHA